VSYLEGSDKNQVTSQGFRIKFPHGGY